MSKSVVSLRTGGSTVVDEVDLPTISNFRWYRHTCGYAYRSSKGRNIYLHRFILGEPDGYVDHINRDRLDNTRSNLRVVSNSINMLNAGPRITNKSGHVGVCPSRNGKWRAYITVDYKQRWLGTYESLEAAIAARTAAEQAADPERFNG